MSYVDAKDISPGDLFLQIPTELWMPERGNTFAPMKSEELELLDNDKKGYYLAVHYDTNEMDGVANVGGILAVSMRGRPCLLSKLRAVIASSVEFEGIGSCPIGIMSPGQFFMFGDQVIMRGAKVNGCVFNYSMSGFVIWNLPAQTSCETLRLKARWERNGG